MFNEPRHVSTGTLRNSFERRTVLIGGLQTGLCVLLAVRTGWIGVVQNAKYETAAESNRVNLTLIPPRRGLILDRNNNPLAANRSDYRVDLIPERLADTSGTIAELGVLLGLGPDKVQDLADRVEKAHRFQPVEVAAGLEWDKFAAVSVRLPDLPGVIAQRGFSRSYPTGPSVGHLVGYVGPASAEEYEKDRNPLLITPGYKVGKDSLEKFFEPSLRGVPGARRAEVTASGKIVRDLDMREDVQGEAVKLTIDGGLQDYASRRIGLESAACVVIDCLDGGILALASMPSFACSGRCSTTMITSPC